MRTTGRSLKHRAGIVEPSGEAMTRSTWGAGSRRGGRRRIGLAFATALALGPLGSCADGTGARAPDALAPDTFTVVFETTAGDFEIEFIRAWSPIAVDRVYDLAVAKFWNGARIYRVNERYAQWGYSGVPERDAEWVPSGVVDEPAKESNVRGTVSFARGGPGTRSAILFVNRTDNSNLDRLPWNGVEGFPPVGRVISGFEAIDALHAGYGDDTMQWEDSIAASGNDFLDRTFPDLDRILSVTLRRPSP
jgi:cyclophilin family peptidyl-prolyl cis-trans isomerase